MNKENFRIDVSIIIATFNNEDIINRTLESVTKQETNYNYEIVITDDSSSDKTYDILKKYKNQFSNLKIFKNLRNKGAGFTRNNSIKNSEGRFLMFCDSDDIWSKSKIQLQIDFMKRNNSKISCTYYENFMSEPGDGSYQKFDKKFTYLDLLKFNQIGTSTACIDTTSFDLIEMPLIRRRQDYAMWLELSKDIQHVDCIDMVLVHRRIRKDSVSSNKLKLIKYNYYVLRNLNNISRIKTIYYLIIYFVKKIYYKILFTKSLNKPF